MLATFLCRVCRTPLGRIDTDTIHLPYTTDQFSPIAPGARVPFVDIVPDYKDWFCPQCDNRPFGEDKILTEGGWVEVKRAVEQRFYAELEKDAPTIDAAILNRVKSDLTCPVCGKVCKNRIGLMGHMRSHKER